MQNIGGEVKIRKVAVHLPRFAGLGPKRGKLRKVAIHLPRLAGKATGGSPAMVSRFEPRKKVWLNLLASAGEWSLIKPAACGWCSPVLLHQCDYNLCLQQFLCMNLILISFVNMRKIIILKR
jgi:hypothetical protein